MPVKTDASGRRSVEAEIEVPGTPDEVWQAIATGPGISSWFVPTKVEERTDGAIEQNFGPGMDSKAKITEWQPPHRFAAETEEEPGTVASEWTVEAQEGGTCKVRVVHSWFASSDKWDHQFEGHAYGWIGYFQILRNYLTHFPGASCTPLSLMAMAAESKGKAWKKLATPLGVAGLQPGAAFEATENAPPLRGVVEAANPPSYPSMLLRVDRPAPALVHLFAMSMGGQTMLPIRIYLYGVTDATAEEIRTSWQSWLDGTFASAAG